MSNLPWLSILHGPGQDWSCCIFMQMYIGCFTLTDNSLVQLPVQQMAT